MARRIPQTFAEFQKLDSDDKRKLKGTLLSRHEGVFCRDLNPDIVHDLEMNDQHVEQVMNTARYENDMNAVSLMLRKMRRTDRQWWETFERALENGGYDKLRLLLNPWEAERQGAAASPSRASHSRRHTGGAAHSSAGPYAGNTHLDHTTGIPSHLEHLDNWRDLADALGLSVSHQRTLSNAAESGKGKVHHFLLDHICQTLGGDATVGRLTSALLSLGDPGEVIVSGMERSGLIEPADRLLDGSDAGAAACGEDAYRRGASAGLGSACPSRMHRVSNPEEKYDKPSIKPGNADGEREQINMLSERAQCGHAESPEEQAGRPVAETQRQAAMPALQAGPFQATNASDNVEEPSPTFSSVDENREDFNIYESIIENVANLPSTSSDPHDVSGDDENKISNLDHADPIKDSQKNKMSSADDAVPDRGTSEGEAHREHQKPPSGLVAVVTDQERELCKASSKLDVSSTQTGTGDASALDTLGPTGSARDSASQVVVGRDCESDCSYSEAEDRQGDDGNGEAKPGADYCDDVCHQRPEGTDTQQREDDCGETRASYSSGGVGESGKLTGAAGEKQEAIAIGTCSDDDLRQSDGRQLQSATSPGTCIQSRNSSPSFQTLHPSCGQTTPSDPTPSREGTQSSFESASWPKPWEKEKHETCLMKPLGENSGDQIDDDSASCPTRRALSFQVEHSGACRSLDQVGTILAPPEAVSEGTAGGYQPVSGSNALHTPPAHLLSSNHKTSANERADVTSATPAGSEETRMLDVNTRVDSNHHHQQQQPPLPSPDERERGLFQWFKTSFCFLAETLNQLE